MSLEQATHIDQLHTNERDAFECDVISAGMDLCSTATKEQEVTEQEGTASMSKATRAFMSSQSSLPTLRGTTQSVDSDMDCPKTQRSSSLGTNKPLADRVRPCHILQQLRSVGNSVDDVTVQPRELTQQQVSELTVERETYLDSLSTAYQQTLTRLVDDVIKRADIKQNSKYHMINRGNDIF